ncbi:MAG: hypothetical protein KatS3mg119_1226 [Rhodothalassiaceae bacterium]|nr:MAG: hypothetical protein KatS3mg119_1226 [Rhodothalassiaceae bacterium]
MLTVLEKLRRRERGNPAAVAAHPVLEPGTLLSIGRPGAVIRLDRRLEGAGGHRYWIVSELAGDCSRRATRRVISEEKLGRLLAGG